MAMDEESRKALKEIIESSRPGGGSYGAIAKAPDGNPATSTTVDFTHTISENELRSTYLNLTDAEAESMGQRSPRTRLS